MNDDQTYLMCRPDHFDINYSINPWMDKDNKVSDQKISQWENLLKTFTNLGVSVKILDPETGLPDMVYVDAGIIYEKTFIPSNFTHPERKPEKEFFKKFFLEQGYDVVEVSNEHCFEGHGDTLWAGDALFFGHGFRSTTDAQTNIETILQDLNPKIEVIPIELIDPRFYHLDTCFCPIRKNLAICYTPAVSTESLSLLKERMEIIEVSEAEACNFACNAVVVNNNIIIPSNTPNTCANLNKKGFRTHQVDMGEFIKGGGACKCLSMPLDPKGV